MLANLNTLRVPFLFDDAASIADNPTIQRLSWRIFSPPHGTGVTVEGRPVLNASLALNYAWSGSQVRSYHVVNLALHGASALLLFGLIRRTLQGATMRESISAHATEIAAAAALLWALHPLQTESVTYIVQRAESLMGFFYLLTLYAFVRGCAASDGRRWFSLSIVACALGMGTKEVMVSAPLIVWLYDRTFVAGSFGAAWRRRRNVHLALAFTWLVLALCVVQSGLRGGTIGAGSGVTWWQYAFCQARGIVHYLGLALWPGKLIFDYGADFVTFADIVPHALLVVALVALTGFALARRPALGFLGAWFFAILAPTSSVLGGTRQMLAEHRMYLSLVAVTVLIALGLHRAFARRAWLAWSALAVVFALLTLRRNADYRSEVAIYRDTVAKRPENGFAHNNLGKALLNAGRVAEAVDEFTLALKLVPTRVMTHNNLAAALAKLGRHEEAQRHAAAALELNPRSAEAVFNLGTGLLRQGQPAAAIPHFERALALQPNYAEAHGNLAAALQQTGRTAEAIAHYETALQLKPDVPETHYSLATAQQQLGRLPAAVEHYDAALRLRPDYPEAHNNLGVALAAQQRTREAIEHYRTALRARPAYAEAFANLGAALVDLQQWPDAIAQLQAALRIEPANVQAHLQLGNALCATGRAADAIPHYEVVVRAAPENAEYHHNLGSALFEGSNRIDDAIAQFTAALRLNPNAAETHTNLGIALAAQGRRAEALQHLETALRLRPDYAFARQELARLRGTGTR